MLPLRRADNGKMDEPRRQSPRASTEPGLILAATPIGNLADMTERVKDLLRRADIIAAEDTRSLHKLLHATGVEVTGSVVSHHEHNEAESARGRIEAGRKGRTVVFVPEAGTAAVSEPGERWAQRDDAPRRAGTRGTSASARM